MLLHLQVDGRYQFGLGGHVGYLFQNVFSGKGLVLNVLAFEYRVVASISAKFVMYTGCYTAR